MGWKAPQYRKDISHIGGHFNDWLTTELWAMTGRKIEYLVVFNDTYSMLFDHLLPVLCRSCSDDTMQYLKKDLQ